MFTFQLENDRRTVETSYSCRIFLMYYFYVNILEL